MRVSGGTAEVTFPGNRPLFYYITDRRQLADGSLTGLVRRALSWGVDFIQIREKDLSDRELFDLTARVMRLARGRECRVLVNGRADVALAAGAHGVHLPSSGVALTDLRSWLPAGFLVGVSVHSMGEARKAARLGAHYLLLGPVFPTPSKLLFGPPLGLVCLRKVCRSVAPTPIFALGGVHPGNIPSVLSAGAAGVAGITLFQRDLADSPRARRDIALLRRRPNHVFKKV